MKYRMRTMPNQARHQDVFSRGGTGQKRQRPSLPVFNLPPYEADEPCKNEGSECYPDGSCIRCGAVQGVSCRPAPAGGAGPRGGVDQ